MTFLKRHRKKMKSLKSLAKSNALWELRHKQDTFQPLQLLVTNYNSDKISVKQTYDGNFKMWRVEVRLKKKLEGTK